MNPVIALARHSVRRSRTLLALLFAVFSGFEVLFVVAAGALQASGTFANLAGMLPAFVRQMFGDSLVAFMSFGGFVCFGYFHPMLVAALCAFAIALGTEPAGELETRFLDLVLARPMRRAAVIARSVLLVVLLPALVIAVMVVSTLLAVRWSAPDGSDIPGRLIVSLAANLWLLVECVGGATLAVASAARRRATAAGAVGLVLFALFFVDYVARIWPPAASLVWLSPFHYFDAMSMVLGQPLPGLHLLVLGTAAAAGMIASFVIFSRRDL